MKNRIVSLVLCVAMILASMSLTVFAAEGADGSVSIAASTVTLKADETVDVTFTVNAKTDAVGAVNFTVILPEGLEYVSHEILVTMMDFMMSAYTPSTGAFGCAVTMTGKTGSFDVLKITLKAKETGVGVNHVGVTLGNMFKVDGSTKMDFGIVENCAITIEGAHTHEWGTEWSKDGEGHWKTCTGCGEADVKAAHTGGTATCSAKAVCEVCGAEYGEVNAENHGETEVRNAVKATCGTPGYTGDTFCKVCNVQIAEGTAVPATGAHTGGTATCTAKAVCEVCGAEYGEVNAENHGETEVKNAVEATETTPGYTGDVHCKDCGALIEKGQEIPATGGEEPVTMGDVNGDGKINNIDAMRILQYYVGMADDINAAAADVSGDGKINNVDAMLILQYYVGLITKFPAA